MTVTIHQVRHHGFTCPACGSHYFSSREEVYMAKPGIHNLGKCRRSLYEPGKCNFEWDRNDAKQEAKCMYTQPREEWEKWYVSRDSETDYSSVLFVLIVVVLITLSLA